VLSKPDSELIQIALDGDDSAFADLIARYQRKIYAVILSNIRNFSDAQDLTQETFFTAYLKLGMLHDSNNFGHWIRKIAINQCRIHAIMQKRTDQVIEEYKNIPSESKIQTENSLTQADLWVALSKLSDDQRLVLTLFYLEKQSYQDIADFLDISRTTVQTRLRYARQALKKEMISLMEKELQSNHLPEGFPEDTMKTARKLTETLMSSIPIELVKFTSQSYNDRNHKRSQIFSAFYNSLTSEQIEAFNDKERKLSFTDLTIDQQAYLRQVLHQIWIWSIIEVIVNPPFYVDDLGNCKLSVALSRDKSIEVEIRRQYENGLSSTIFCVELE
jgi:RNA polymerase sigma factor (sigma-70 family)